MASAVPLTMRILPTQDAIIACDESGAPKELVVHPRVGDDTVKHLHDVVDALDFLARSNAGGPAHGATAEAHR
jgi:hypothetical protein